MKIVFFGTPDIAVKTLEALIDSTHEVVGVVTQLDKEAGRGKKLAFSPVKVVALKNNIPVFQFKKIRKEGVQDLKNLNADIFITFAYGQILSQEILDIAKYGTINIHASLLPLYRGAAPINWVLMLGETKTGITIMHTAAGIDDGDMILKKEIEILPHYNAQDLTNMIASEAPHMILEVLAQIEQGTAQRIPQNHEESTYFPMLKSTDGKLWLEKSAHDVVNQIRGLTPNPGTYVVLGEKMLKVFSAKARPDILHNETAGVVLVSSAKGGLVLSCGNHEAIELIEVQAPGGKRMTAKAFLCGNSIAVGEVAK